MDDLVRQIMIADGDRTALRAPRFRIAEQIGARRRQILLRLEPEERALREAREAIPGRRLFESLQDRGRRLATRAQEIRIAVRQADGLGQLYDLAPQVDTFAQAVTRFAQDVEAELRAAAQERTSAGKVIVAAAVVAAGIAAVALLRKRRELSNQVSALQRRVTALPGQLQGFSRAKRIRGRVEAAAAALVSLQGELEKRSSIVSLGGLEKKVGERAQEVEKLERDVVQFIQDRKAAAQAISEARTERRERARDRIFERRRETPEKKPPLYFYITARDERVRGNHRPLDGLVLTRDAFFARAIDPPNGYNCRCAIVKLDEGRADRLYQEQVDRLGSLEKAIAFFESRPIPRGGGRDPGFR